MQNKKECLGFWKDEAAGCTGNPKNWNKTTHYLVVKRKTFPAVPLAKLEKARKQMLKQWACLFSRRHCYDDFWNELEKRLSLENDKK